MESFWRLVESESSDNMESGWRLVESESRDNMESFRRLVESESRDNMASLCPTARKFPQLLEDSEEPTVDPLPGDSGDCFEGSRVLPIFPEPYPYHYDGRSIPIPLLHIRI
jgi:hypothetical protein